MEQITLDLIPKGSLPVLHASQYDDGRQWKVNLKENGEDYTLSDETIVLDVRKGDGCAVTCAVAIESGKKYVILTSTEQMCAVAGQNLAELQITKGNMKIGTLNFILQVERDPLNGSISSASEIHDLQHQVDECVDNALADLGASGLPYDNTESGLEATNVQQAIDEVNEKASDLASDLDDKADKSNTYTKSEVNDIADTKADANNVYAKSETYTKTEVDTLIRNLPEPMIFKGTLGVGGTIQSLPAASTSNEGYTYKVITEGTYAGTSAKVGDVFVSSGSAWVLIPAGDEDNDTWRAIKVNGVEKLGNAISSGSVDFVDTANVKFEFDSNGNAVKATLNGIDTSSEVDAKVAGLIDDTSTANNKTWSSEKISTELAALLPVDEVSGAVANFDTDVVLPLIDVKAEIKAVETGTGAKSPSNPYVISGVSAVSVVNCHKNLYEYDESKVTTGTTTTSTTRAYYPLGFKGVSSLTFSAKLKSGSSITASDYLNIGKLRKSDGLIEILSQFITPYGITTITLSISSDDEVVLMSLENPTVIKSIMSRYDLQIEVGSTATTYEAYNGTTHSVSWQTEAGEVFGGEVDVTNGKLVVTHHGFTLTGAEEEGWTVSNTGTANYYYVVSLPTGSSSAVGGSNIANIFPSVNVGNNNTTQGCYNTASALRVRWGTEMTVADWKTWLGTNNLTVVYRLATPIEYDLADTADISAFAGINNVWGDTNGDTTVDYKLGIQAYIDKKIAEVQALVL